MGQISKKTDPQNDDGKLRRIMILAIINSVKPMSKPKKRSSSRKMYMIVRM